MEPLQKPVLLPTVLIAAKLQIPFVVIVKFELSNEVWQPPEAKSDTQGENCQTRVLSEGHQLHQKTEGSGKIIKALDDSTTLQVKNCSVIAHLTRQITSTIHSTYSPHLVQVRAHFASLRQENVQRIPLNSNASLQHN
jgi:hypothetical protein